MAQPQASFLSEVQLKALVKVFKGLREGSFVPQETLKLALNKLQDTLPNGSKVYMFSNTQARDMMPRYKQHWDAAG